MMVWVDSCNTSGIVKRGIVCECVSCVEILECEVCVCVCICVTRLGDQLSEVSYTINMSGLLEWMDSFCEKCDKTALLVVTMMQIGASEREPRACVW